MSTSITPTESTIQLRRQRYGEDNNPPSHESSLYYNKGSKGVAGANHKSPRNEEAIQEDAFASAAYPSPLSTTSSSYGMTTRGSARLFVGDIKTLGKDDLERAFLPFGRIREIWMAQYPPGFAFVEYFDREHALLALEKLNGAFVKSDKLRVEFSKTRNSSGKPPPSSQQHHGGPHGGRYRSSNNFFSNNGSAGYGHPPANRYLSGGYNAASAYYKQPLHYDEDNHHQYYYNSKEAASNLINHNSLEMTQPAHYSYPFLPPPPPSNSLPYGSGGGGGIGMETTAHKLVSHPSTNPSSASFQQPGRGGVGSTLNHPATKLNYKGPPPLNYNGTSGPASSKYYPLNASAEYNKFTNNNTSPFNKGFQHELTYNQGGGSGGPYMLINGGVAGGTGQRPQVFVPPPPSSYVPPPSPYYPPGPPPAMPPTHSWVPPSSLDKSSLGVLGGHFEHKNYTCKYEDKLPPSSTSYNLLAAQQHESAIFNKVLPNALSNKESTLAAAYDHTVNTSRANPQFSTLKGGSGSGDYEKFLAESAERNRNRRALDDMALPHHTAAPYNIYQSYHQFQRSPYLPPPPPPPPHHFYPPPPPSLNGGNGAVHPPYHQFMYEAPGYEASHATTHPSRDKYDYPGPHRYYEYNNSAYHDRGNRMHGGDKTSYDDGDGGKQQWNSGGRASYPTPTKPKHDNYSFEKGGKMSNNYNYAYETSSRGSLQAGTRFKAPPPPYQHQEKKIFVDKRSNNPPNNNNNNNTSSFEDMMLHYPPANNNSYEMGRAGAASAPRSNGSLSFQSYRSPTQQQSSFSRGPSYERSITPPTPRYNDVNYSFEGNGARNSVAGNSGGPPPNPTFPPIQYPSVKKGFGGSVAGPKGRAGGGGNYRYYESRDDSFNYAKQQQQNPHFSYGLDPAARRNTTAYNDIPSRSYNGNYFSARGYPLTTSGGREGHFESDRKDKTESKDGVIGGGRYYRPYNNNNGPADRTMDSTTRKFASSQMMMTNPGSNSTYSYNNTRGGPVMAMYESTGGYPAAHRDRNKQIGGGSSKDACNNNGSAINGPRNGNAAGGANSKFLSDSSSTGVKCAAADTTTSGDGDTAPDSNNPTKDSIKT